FRFVAAATGPVAVRMTPVFGSALDCNLTVFDGAENRIANNDSVLGTSISLVEFTAVAGQTYFLQAAGNAQGTGAYVLSVRNFSGARPLELDASGAARVSGMIERPGGVDLFRFVAPVAERLTIFEGSNPGSSLDSVLAVFDADSLGAAPQGPLAFNDDSAG